MSEPAILALQDGTVFHGRAIGASGRAVGEVIFNTAMSGYQEILTDPSYARQLVCLTYPHIGNVGANPADAEAPGIMAAGLIVRDYAMAASNYRADCSLSEYLKSQSVVGIADVDTRRLTRHLREHGAMAGCIATGADLSPDDAVAAARDFPGLAGMDLAREVTTETPYEWLEGSYDLDEAAFSSRDSRHHVVAYDFGVKRNILRMLADRGCRVTVVPATTPASEVRNMAPDGVFLSNGPGDPEPCDYAIEAISELITGEAPVFGICLGHQLLGLAAGARTMKMKFGHHGANHPVKDLDSERVFITSQNHGFALDESSLPKRIRVTHRSLFDDTIQGIELQDAPAFSFQGHPEASPGPHDLGELFDRFVEMMEQRHA